MKGVSGMLGDVVVYRELRGSVIMSNRPKKRELLTPQQEETKSRFLRAVAYAKRQIADPVSKALYQPSPHSRLTSAYAAAVADYLKAPEIRSIDTTRYAGAIGDEILIRAFDDFKVTSVLVSITSAAGNLLEQGVPELLLDSVDDYVYKATVANAVLPGTKISVVVRDKPGNTTVKEIVV